MAHTAEYIMNKRLVEYVEKVGASIKAVSDHSLPNHSNGTMGYFDLFIDGKPQGLMVFCRPERARDRIAERLAVRSGRIPRETMRFRLWTYDVWGNEEDGYEVNNRFSTGTVLEFKVKGTVQNAGTPSEFIGYYLTSSRINRALGCTGVTWEGDNDFTVYGERPSDRYPECELVREYDE